MLNTIPKAETIVAILTIITLLFAGFKQCKKFLKYIYEKYVKSVIDRVDEMDRKVTEYVIASEQLKKQAGYIELIRKEVSPNGGSSIKDQVGKIYDIVKLMDKTNTAMIYLDNNPVAKFNNDGMCVFVNQKWLEITGFSSQEDAHGIGWYRAIHPDDKEYIISQWEEAVETESIFIAEFRYKNIVNSIVTKVKTRTSLIREKDEVILVISVTEILN